jgi:hypothetical protein
MKLESSPDPLPYQEYFECTAEPMSFDLVDLAANRLRAPKPSAHEARA